MSLGIILRDTVCRQLSTLGWIERKDWLMATRLVQVVANGKLGYREENSNRRPSVVNGKLGFYTPEEIREEEERRQVDPRDEVVEFDDYDR